MEIDSALFSTFAEGESLPALRIYRWERPAFTVGYFQKPEELLDLEYCAAMGVPVVRRITGGGAVYHHKEITYSIVCSQAHLGAGTSVKESYKLLTSFIIDMYRSLGLDARYALDVDLPGRGGGKKHTYCLAGKEEYDILINGKKIGGNAQRRSRSVIFQHGSIPLSLPHEDILRFLLPGIPQMEEQTISLEEAGIHEKEKALEDMLIKSFQKKFNPLFVED